MRLDCQSDLPTSLMISAMGLVGGCGVGNGGKDSLSLRIYDYGLTLHTFARLDIYF